MRMTETLKKIKSLPWIDAAAAVAFILMAADLFSRFTPVFDALPPEFGGVSRAAAAAAGWRWCTPSGDSFPPGQRAGPRPAKRRPKSARRNGEAKQYAWRFPPYNGAGTRRNHQPSLKNADKIPSLFYFNIVTMSSFISQLRNVIEIIGIKFPL